MFEPLVIQSHKGPYSVSVGEDVFSCAEDELSDKTKHYIVDSKVAGLYSEKLKDVLNHPSILLIEASESNKTLDKFTSYVEHLVSKGARRSHVLVAIGGGIIQDITCFLAATLLRGIDWYFHPTTLLAQADSCIGSKSSINVGEAKNLLGTFTPPRKIWISTCFLDTLDERDIRSGVGEMLKVHAIEDPRSFDAIAADYEKIFKNKSVLIRYLRRSLEIKKAIIEADEFDSGLRNVMNYGHTFGHALESATNFRVPHGIAVTIGMDLANYAAFRLGKAGRDHFDRMHPVLNTNFRGFSEVEIPMDAFFKAISKDKKNTSSKLSLVLPDAGGKIERGYYDNDDLFHSSCRRYFTEEFRK